LFLRAKTRIISIKLSYHKTNGYTTNMTESDRQTPLHIFSFLHFVNISSMERIN